MKHESNVAFEATRNGKIYMPSLTKDRSKLLDQNIYYRSNTTFKCSDEF